mmetsp:Transcript_783/g.2541  ORF Transcript_783/g.2541 Transcript_783/m.2541 type:complete len:115 (+) Transcript_783:181-525(+)|eukprot:CAMPEP_0198732520 /NCGR_PEP_ID=MMETSP1475-20131203/36466_1 /TAXON_ID= ORGANISM="Unidentified sp., Strain CCMP1999" /NCGR_SAMPLE_ID=MMETSP1475 /ASSEMBLY_ACC=CAM_ASM_001111 /LENGTH=114 /DNA_ID=CAMNT_0044495657 /DNA_START=86 /DNA_END=430 /DNA_ORIENTATION=-
MLELVFWLFWTLQKWLLQWVLQDDKLDVEMDGAVAYNRVDRHRIRMQECFDSALKFDGKAGFLRVVQRKVLTERASPSVLPVICEDEELLECSEDEEEFLFSVDNEQLERPLEV